MRTSVIIFSSFQLDGAAWQALLKKQPQISPIAQTQDVSHLVQILQKKTQGAILLDVWHEPSDFVARIREVTDKWHILVLIPAYELEDIVQLLQVGAMGCLTRDAAVGDLARSLIATARGELVLPPEIASQVLLALARGKMPPTKESPTLSPREEEVITLLAQGMTNKEIAQKLILSARTVEAHLRNIFGKLDLQSRTEAALWAVQHGYSDRK